MFFKCLSCQIFHCAPYAPPLLAGEKKNTIIEWARSFLRLIILFIWFCFAFIAIVNLDVMLVGWLVFSFVRVCWLEFYLDFQKCNMLFSHFRFIEMNTLNNTQEVYSQRFNDESIRIVNIRIVNDVNRERKNYNWQKKREKLISEIVLKLFFSNSIFLRGCNKYTIKIKKNE